MRIQKTIAGLALTALVAGCSADLALTDPSRRTTDTFWQNQTDAISGLNAVYNGLQNDGVFGRWIYLPSDGRTDVATSRSPWTDLQNWTKTVLISSNFGPSSQVYSEHYQGIYRANQVLANVPNITMDEAVKKRVLAEAKFLRGVYYYNLALLFGNVPVVTQPARAGDFPATSPQAEVYAQVIKDATEAAADLPVRSAYAPNDMGRATKGGALALAAEAQLQLKKWPDAAALFQQVVESGEYRLAPSFAENFRVEGDNNSEGVFEVQFGGPSVVASGTRGEGISKLVGPPGIGFTDVQPSEWYFQQFFVEGGGGNPDPRLDATLFYNRPGGMDVHGQPFATRYPSGFKDTDIDHSYFWKKQGEYYLPTQEWDNAINVKVIRYAGVLLMYADALNEAGRTSEAATYVNQVRTRVGLPPVVAVTQAAMRAAIEHEMLMELGWENTRLAYLTRHDMFKKELLLPREAKFSFFVNGQSELLPIPQTERDLNPNIKQNPGWN